MQLHLQREKTHPVGYQQDTGKYCEAISDMQPFERVQVDADSTEH